MLNASDKRSLLLMMNARGYIYSDLANGIWLFLVSGVHYCWVFPVY
jgi:hypothetical protein